MNTTVTMTLEEFRKMEKIISYYDSLCTKLTVHNLGVPRGVPRGEPESDIGIQFYLPLEVNHRDWYHTFKALVNRKEWPSDFEALK